MKTIADLRVQFSNELEHLFSANELKLILKTSITKRFELTDTDYLLLRDLEIEAADRLYFESIIGRLKKNEPFQYVIGSTEFYGLEMLCDGRALIPRPETEELVDWIAQTVKGQNNLYIADICSGSGCIALALKSVNESFIIDALELSDEALDLLEENISFTGLSVSQLKFDALSDQYISLEKEYAVVVSNPPYIPQEDEQRMEQNVLSYEPHMALFVEDKDPFIFYERIASNCIGLLEDNGWLFFEIHEDFAPMISDVLEEQGFVNIELRKDLQGKERMIRGQKVLSRHEQK
ncbi:MAG: release factor glutamine methyltransferase [Flavobacteriaceae bacterium]|jgi:release factor glutamine methyltransferase